MDTIVIHRVALLDGRYAWKYPHTPVLWDMEGYYFPPAEDGALHKLSDEEVARLVPKV